ncbi:MAG: Dam family site-specific DNA-(adenine-N6)-methyltransferase [Nitrospirota bacterium]|nr:Dam family site-specific DNA-(adenine-N6)-methyltransferase [Nitrospirota bacterium]
MKPQLKNAKPFLRWAGSKKQLIPILSQYWDSSYNRYVEPFAGSASLFFNIAPSAALLSDINVDLIATYSQIKNNLPAVIRSLYKLKKSPENYMRIRAMDPSKLSPSTRAARFIFLNRYCFNGLYRTNRAGIFNVPYGGDRSGDLPNKLHLKACSTCLKTARLVSCGFSTTLEAVVPGDFVYMDPPYSVKAQRVFSEYDASVFSEKQLKLVKQWMRKLDRKGIPFLVSYASSNEGEFLSKGFYTQVVSVKRNIAGFAANRRRSDELLISNVHPSKEGEIL